MGNGKKKSTQQSQRNSESFCSTCNNISTKTDLSCKICDCSFHHNCVGISDDVFKGVMPFLASIGWVCNDCTNLISTKRESMKKEIDDLRSSVKKQEDEIHSITEKLEEISTKFDSFIYNQPSISNTTRETSQTPPIKHIQSSVNEIENDSKRRYNVIISGLRETGDDKSEVSEMLHTALKIQPIITGCRRIGKQPTDRPRKMLVTFAHKSARDDVLTLARQMKLSTLPTATGIFVNPDLSPEESRIAYEKRQARKLQHITGNATGTPDTKQVATNDTK